MSLVDMAGEAFVIATVVVAALALACVWYLLFGRNRNASIDSIAVLPFQNKSVNTDAEYLFDGLTYRLSQLPNLKVSATSSVFRYSSASHVPVIVRFSDGEK